jgi:hypothetical protein
MNLRVSAEDAGWSIREAAWSFEERVLWRGSDTARRALEPVARHLQPLQRLVQTRLTWPLSDALRERSEATRAAIAAGATVLALGAAAAGALNAPHDSPIRTEPVSVASVTRAPSSDAPVLQGVTPRLEAARPVTAPPPQTVEKPRTPPAQVAWRFAQAFVSYEVGRSAQKTAAVFGATASKQLAKTLAGDPPRLPAHGKVPKARVLNVVLGQPAKNQLSASVSLVRLRAISELRLTLIKAGKEWRVAQVLG